VAPSPSIRSLVAASSRAALLALALGSTACASLVTGKVADALSETGSTFGSDEDPDLVAAAVPFGLKTMESVLVSQPEHRGLLTALASGFVQYGYAFVDMPADELLASDLAQGQAQKARAAKLFLRARGYALRGLEVEHPGIAARLRAEPTAAAAELELDDVPIAYWTAASWGLAISARRSDLDLIAEIPILQALADRLIALAPDYGAGVVYELLMSVEGTRPDASAERAKGYFDAAERHAAGRRVGHLVSYAASWSVKRQDYREFKALLDRALAHDLEASPNDRLANVLMQRRARWLLARASDLFVDTDDAPAEAP
jgi:predicted anti-sigma-YlaC factor YlaD